MKKWVFFDFDGVIIDSEVVSLRSWKSLLKDPDSINMADISGNSALENAKKLQGRLKEKRDVDKVVEIKLALDEAQLDQGYYHIVDGAKKVIEDLSEHYNLAVVTSNSETVTSCHLRFHDLDDYFKKRICACPLTRKKPSPDLYLEALRICECSSDNAIAIEDSPAGIRSARDANVRVIGFGDAVRNHEEHSFWLDGFQNGKSLFESVERLLV